MHEPHWSGRSVRFAFLAVATLALCALPGPALQAGVSDKTPAARGFIENRGQIDSAVRFYAAGDRSAVYFTAEGPVFEIRGTSPANGEKADPLPAHPTRGREQRTRSRASRVAMAIRFVDARPSVEISGLDALPARSHFLTGNDAERWRTDVPTYERVVYHDVWPGIDLVFRIAEGGLVYEIAAQPGADLDEVQFTHDGAREFQQSPGVLRLETPLGSIEHRTASSSARSGTIRIAGDRAPSAGSQPAVGSAEHSTGAQSSAFAPGDPVLGMELWWSTFLGGTRDEAVYAVAVEDEVRAIVTGATRSTDFPTTLGVVDPDYNSSFDVFVTKFSYDGSTVLWSTYLGGSNDDRGWAIAVDDTGRPVIAGVTSSPDYPVTVGAFDTSFNGLYDAYVTKLSADGTALVFSSYYGGDDREWDVSGLDLDSTGRVVLAGSTRSADLPTSVGAYDTVLGGTQDAFVAALSADGSTLSFGTYLGGASTDGGEDVTFDSTGRPLLVGSSSSTDYPTTPGVLQTVHGGARDSFVTKFTADAGSLVFSTLLGGNGDDDGYAVVLDESDRILMTGATTSSNFPTTPGAFSTTYAGGRDAFVTRLTADGTAQIWGTYFGGTGEEKGLGIVEDSVERPIFVGWTCSDDFPLAGPPLIADYFTCDGFLTRLTPDGSAPLFSSYIGGWRDDSVFALALTELDRVVAAGETFSPNFATTSYAYDQTHNSPHEWYDAFVLDLLTPKYCTLISGTVDPLLLMAKAVDGNCPQGTPEGQLIDVVEGQLENLDPVDVGGVRRIACESPKVVFGTDNTPPPGFGLFQMARFNPDGTYTDGAETGLVGVRTIVDGDCP